MNTSKIIKIEDTDKSTIKNFFLRQFPKKENDDKPGRGKKNAAQHSVLLDIDRLKKQAEQEARLIVDNAQREAQRIEKESYNQGLTKGIREGRRKSEQELSTLIESFKNIIAGVEKIKEEFYNSHHDMILGLSLEIARKVIHQEVVSNKELILGVLNSALRHAIDREKLEVRINPEDMDLCMQKRRDIIRNIDGIKQIVFEPDETVGRGGAIIASVFGEIDARIEQQFAKVETELIHTQQQGMENREDAEE